MENIYVCNFHQIYTVYLCKPQKEWVKINNSACLCLSTAQYTSKKMISLRSRTAIIKSFVNFEIIYKIQIEISPPTSRIFNDKTQPTRKLHSGNTSRERVDCSSRTLHKFPETIYIYPVPENIHINL